MEQPMHDDEDAMLDEVLSQMLGDTEKETDKSLFPDVKQDGNTVTITISAGAKPEDKKPEDEPEDGGYDALMKGLPQD